MNISFHENMNNYMNFSISQQKREPFRNIINTYRNEDQLWSQAERMKPNFIFL